MSQVYIPVSLRRLVSRRAARRCEYCLLHQDDTPFTHPIDHVIAIKHGGETTADNLALACIDCNRNKGSDLTTFDPASGQITPLFNPRTEQWSDHFLLDGALILGRTAIGRATIVLLRLNEPQRLITREVLLSIGRYPV